MKKLYRCRWNRKVSGLCGGLGVYFNLDPTLVRLLFIASTLLSLGLTLILYFLGWAFIPKGPAAYIPSKGKRLYRSLSDRRISGVCSGLSRFFGIDVKIVRIATVALMLLTGIFPLLGAYFVATLVVPERRASDSFHFPR